jgi:lipid-binding SYLF domain-containing protein
VTGRWRAAPLLETEGISPWLSRSASFNQEADFLETCRHNVDAIGSSSYRRIAPAPTNHAQSKQVNQPKIMKPIRHILIPLMIAGATLLTTSTASADDLASQSRIALRQLVSQNPAAVRANRKALAILVFPDVVKAGFIFGAQGGKGILFEHGQPRGRYRTVAASYGLQAGVQKYGYALFLMNQKAVDWVNNTRGWEIGTGPSVVIVDKGMARSFSTDTLHSGIYAFTFDQQGLMAGLGLQGSKITRID